jgi:hypothetical protein
MWGRRGKDCTTNTRETRSGCGKQDGKGANGCRKGEGTSGGKLRGMGMMG